MAKAKETSSRGVIKSAKKKRPGIHSKKKNSISKTSKNYTKAYAAQGR
jgi:hypothetical protein